MGRTWSDRAIQEQREINRWVESEKRSQNAFDVNRRPEIPTLVQTKVSIPPLARGDCTFLEGGLNSALVETDRKEVMYNLSSQFSIPAESQCIATRVALPWSGEAGWALIRDQGGSSTSTTFGNCAACFGKRIATSIDVSFSGVTDGSAAVGTAALINATHTLTEANFANSENCSLDASITDTAEGAGDIVIILRPTSLFAGQPKWEFEILQTTGVWRQRISSNDSIVQREDGLLLCAAQYSGTIPLNWGFVPISTGSPPDFSGATITVNA